MKSQELIDKIKNLWIGLQDQIKILKTEKRIELDYAQFALMETDESIRKIKGWVIGHDFDCWENEITFFKELKPQFISQYIYFSKIVAYLSSFPASGIKYKKKIIESEFEKLQYFFIENSEFVSYYRRKATYLDRKHFLRFKYDLDVKLAPDFHSYDERFSTTHDYLVATIIAYDQYEAFLKAQVNLLKEENHKLVETDTSKIHWTASKTDLVELVFALHQAKCLNHGASDLAETVRWFEAKMNIDLGNYHKTFGEIRNRKTPQTRFLEEMSEGLQKYIDGMD